MAEVSVVQYGHVWVGACTTHGQLPVYWVSPLAASLDVMGHAAHHHPRSKP